MEKIKLIMDEFDVREVCLQITHDYYPSKTTVETTEDEYGKDITITVEASSYTDKIYGREILGKYYYARHDIINKKPMIDWYEEFFSQGKFL